MAKAVVLKTAGINCDEETVHALTLAGASAELLFVGSLFRGERRLDEFDILVVPGGFSYGDDLGAGTVLANQLRSCLSDDLRAFVESGKLVLGICNGFQVLVRLGILPGWGDGKAVSLIENSSGKFEDRWVRMGVESDRCPFLAESASGCIRSPIAHAEGRFVVRDDSVLERLRDQGQIALTYRRLEPQDGEYAHAQGEYPANPNGSIADIAGITNERGNVLGLMPHPERFLHGLQDPLWTRTDPADRPSAEDLPRAGEGYTIFEQAVRSISGDPVEVGKH